MPLTLWGAVIMLLTWRFVVSPGASMSEPYIDMYGGFASGQECNITQRRAG